MKIVSHEEWERIERLLMEAEVPYSVSFDSHIMNECCVIYDKMIEIKPFKIQVKVDN